MITAANGRPYQHFVLTPFYVRRFLGHAEPHPLPGADWLDERIGMFSKYCLPSVLGQTDRRFHWLIYIADDTPLPQLDKIKALIAGHDHITLWPCPVWRRAPMVESINSLLEPGADWLLTTRLDNDDGWHERFVERLHDAVRPGVTELLNFPDGVIVSNRRLYGYRHESNAFISFSEPLASMKTPFVTGHEQLGTVAPIRQLGAPRAFYQVVHSSNFSNRIRGRRLSTAAAIKDFGTLDALVDWPRDDGGMALAFENFLLFPLRQLRDAAVGAAKSLRKLVRRK